MNGFALLELLIVIGIVAILATIVILVLNPAEFLRQSRDTQRINDLANINKALVWLQADQPNANFGTASTTYLSLPDTDDANPPDCDEYSLPSLPSGWSYYCALKSTFRKTDSTGWIPVNLQTLFSTGSPLSDLPIDPVNTAANGLYYTYVAGGSWKLTSLFESDKYAPKMNSDGGPDVGIYEIGNDLNLANFQRGLVGYWKFDETGTSANDSSGYNNAGTMYSFSTVTNLHTSSGCKVGSCGSFDGTDDYVTKSSAGFAEKPGTISLWFKANSINAEGGSTYQKMTLIQYGDIYWGLQISSSNNKIQYHYYDGSVYDWYTSAAISTGQWYHLVAVSTPSGSEMFLSGVSQGTSALTLFNNNCGPSCEFVVGGKIAGYPSGDSFNGLIDDVRIYNRALSATEVSAIYNATR